MRGTALRGETEHCHARVFEASYRLGCLCGADGNLCQLVGIWHGRHGHVAHDDNTILAILRLFGDEQHGTADAGNARSALDDLQSWAQCVTRCRESTRYLSVGTFSLDNHATQVEWVLHQLASLLDGHALLLAQLGQQFCIFLATGVVQRVDDGSLVDVLKSILLGIGLDALGVTNEDDVGHVFSQYAVGSAQSALFFCLRKHDALLVGFRACYDLL